MTHYMTLVDLAFNAIKNKTKTIEMRLNDEKRKLIKINDLIIFTNNVTNEKLVVYSPINDRSIVWVRPYNMWNEIVDKDNKIKRFELDSNG